MVAATEESLEGAPVGQRNSPWALVTFCSTAAVLNAALWGISPPEVPLMRLLLASSLLWVMAGSLYRITLAPKNEIPFIPAVVAANFVYFALPIFLDTVQVKMRIYERPEVTVAVGVALGGIAILMVSYYSPLSKIIEALPRLRIPIDLAKVPWLLLSFAVLGTVFVVLVGRGGLPTVLRAPAYTLLQLPSLMISALFLVHLRGSLSVIQQALTAGLFALNLALALSTAKLAPVALLVAPLIFLYVARRRKVPYAAIVVAVLLAIPFLKTKHEYRRALERTHMTTTERIETFFSITYERLSDDGIEFFLGAARTSQDRASALGVLALVIRETPRRIPYWDGETYRAVLWWPIPRVLAPNKPLHSIGQDFGHRYRLLNPKDLNTSFNTPQIVEMYINFGYWGIALGMVIVGLYYRILRQVLNHPDGGEAVLAVAAVTFASQLNIESGSSVLLGAPMLAGVSWLMMRAIAFLATATER